LTPPPALNSLVLSLSGVTPSLRKKYFLRQSLVGSGGQIQKVLPQ
jgi:hypothetical protein